MRYAAALPLVAASLIGSASLAESANAEKSNPYALDRLFLDSTDDTPLYDVLTFGNATEVANYYGATSHQAQLANEFFDGYSGSSANMIFTRIPDLPARAHLYGANIRDVSIKQLQAINGTLSITSQDYDYSTTINLSGVKTFTQAATDIGKAFNNNLPIAATTTGSSIAPVSLSFNGSINAAVLTVNSVSSGDIYVGSYISGKGIPANTQITAQLSGTPNGAGTYSLFLRSGYISSETMTEKYGVLTVGSVSSGQVAVGQQVTDAGGAIPKLTAIEDSLSGSGAGSTWVVNYALNEASQNMTMTGAPLYVNYRKIDGATENSGYLLVQQAPTFNWDSSSLTYMGGSAAKELGVADDSTGAFLSTPGQVVTSYSEWMNDFVAAGNPDGSNQWSTFQTIYDPKKDTPAEEEAALEAWAKSTDGQYKYLKGYSANTPPIVDSMSNAEQLFAPSVATVPEPSTWAMILIGFAGLGLAEYCRSGKRRLAIPSGRLGFRQARLRDRQE
jgi:hypothetical protein